MNASEPPRDPGEPALHPDEGPHDLDEPPRGPGEPPPNPSEPHVNASELPRDPGELSHDPSKLPRTTTTPCHNRFTALFPGPPG